MESMHGAFAVAEGDWLELHVLEMSETGTGCGLRIEAGGA